MIIMFPNWAAVCYGFGTLTRWIITFVFFAALTIGRGVDAQSLNAQINALAQSPEGTVVDISRNMLSLLEEFETGGVDLSPVLNDIARITVVSLPMSMLQSDGVKNALLKAARKEQMEELINVTDGPERITFMAGQTASQNVSNILVTVTVPQGQGDEGPIFTVVWLEGEFDLKKISKFAESLDK